MSLQPGDYILRTTTSSADDFQSVEVEYSSFLGRKEGRNHYDRLQTTTIKDLGTINKLRELMADKNWNHVWPATIAITVAR